MNGAVASIDKTFALLSGSLHPRTGADPESVSSEISAITPFLQSYSVRIVGL